MNIIIRLEGGLVENAVAQSPNEVFILDYDTEGAEEEEIIHDLDGRACTIRVESVGYSIAERLRVEREIIHLEKEIAKKEHELSQEAETYLENEAECKSGREREVILRALELVREMTGKDEGEGE